MFQTLCEKEKEREMMMMMMRDESRLLSSRGEQSLNFQLRKNDIVVRICDENDDTGDDDDDDDEDDDCG